MSKLSLNTRKNIKDSEPKRDAHIKTIAGATGITFEIEVDWPVAVAVAEARDWKDRAGDLLYDSYLKALAENIVKFCKEPIQKEAFVNAFEGKKQIRFDVIDAALESSHPKSSAYSWTTNEGGVLTAHIPKNRFPSNVDDCGKDLTAACSEAGALSVATRKNISDNAKKFEEHMIKLGKALGLQMTYEVDWAEVAVLAEAKGRTDRAADCIGYYLEALASNFTKLASDEMIKEAIAEACEKKVVTFKFVEKADSSWKSSYNRLDFVDGAIVISIPKGNFISNVDDIGRDAADRL